MQSNLAVRPSMTSRMSSLRVNRGSVDGETLRFALEVNSSENSMRGKSNLNMTFNSFSFSFVSKNLKEEKMNLKKRTEK